MPSREQTRFRSRVDPTPQVQSRTDPVVWGGAAIGPLDEPTVRRYERDGFLQMDSLLEPGEVTALRDEVERLVTDPAITGSERAIHEPASDEVRSLFEVQRVSRRFAELFADERLSGVARQLLGSDVYVHQSRVNRKPGFRGRDFYWHSDFETWHVEDGMPAMRAVSIAIALSENRIDNGSLMVVPGSHRTFVGCVGDTPDDHYRQSLRAQQYGVPDDRSLADLVRAGGIATVTGAPGSAVLFDCNTMHGSNSNITPFDRANVFVVFNSVDNRLVEPFGGTRPRPEFLAARKDAPSG
jgi:ectoine hydroxylase